MCPGLIDPGPDFGCQYKFLAEQSHRRLEIRLTSATNSAEPIMDQTTGNAKLPASTTKSSGRAISLAIHPPISAPIKPTAIDTRQPPLEKPVIACPIAPQRPAMISKRKKSIIVKISSCSLLKLISDEIPSDKVTHYLTMVQA